MTTETAATTEKTRRPRSPRIPDTAIIHMGKDDAGVAYGPSHNPKREGSAAHKRWPGYGEGKTVAEVKAAGLTAGDITYDRDHGFISIEMPAVAATETAKAA